MSPRFVSLVLLMFLVGGGLVLWLQPQSQPLPASPQQSAPQPVPQPVSKPEPRPSTSTASNPLPSARTARAATRYILALSWQPAFCEGRPSRPECTSQTARRADADRFSLHGLWPQDSDYCNVSASVRATDEAGRWDRLPAPRLASRTASALAVAMPGAQSSLDRHQWIKHGTCSGLEADAYFAASIALLDELNSSPVQALFAANLGKRITQQQVRAAFDRAFGTGAGKRVRLACDPDGNRQLISELTIGLNGDVVGDSLGELIAGARPTDGGCNGGAVDRVGLQ